MWCYSKQCGNDGLIRLNKFVSRITDDFCNLFYYYYPNTPTWHLGRVCKGGPWAWLRPREPILVFGGVFSSLSLAHAVQILLSLMALRKRWNRSFFGSLARWSDGQVIGGDLDHLLPLTLTDCIQFYKHNKHDLNRARLCWATMTNTSTCTIWTGLRVARPWPAGQAGEVHPRKCARQPR